MSFPDARIELFSVYKTRCNICGCVRTEPVYAHFFKHQEQELQCCDSCVRYAPSKIERKEYWDRTYNEPDAGEPLWRYMELSKFLDIILFRRLWLSQVTALEDTFEGALGTLARQADWRKWMSEFLNKALSTPIPGEKKPPVEYKNRSKEVARLLGETENALTNQRKTTYVSCFHRSKHESFLMWQVYANKRPDSVCVKTNLVRITKCLGSEFRVGTLKYINYKSTFPDVNWPFLYKRAAFTQENEARIFIRNREEGSGFHVPIDPEILIDEVVVSPAAPAWLVENLYRVVDLSGLKINLRTSDLNEGPF